MFWLTRGLEHALPLVLQPVLGGQVEDGLQLGGVVHPEDVEALAPAAAGAALKAEATFV